MNSNFSCLIEQICLNQPGKRAVVVRTGENELGRRWYSHLTFAQFGALRDTYVHGLRAEGIKPGMRVVLMVRPGLDFLPLCFALHKLGAVVVLIDPGMGRKNLIRCIKHTEPEAFIGIPQAHVAKLLFRDAFRSVKVSITIGKRWFWGGPDLAALMAHGSTAVEPYPVAPDDPAAIIFTTGSTGPPKGVVYTHSMFAFQTETLQNVFRLTPDDVDMPGFALFALFSISMGVTVVLPEMDPTRPANVDPERIIEVVQDHGATFSFGSPALWNTVSRYCVRQGVRLPSLRTVVMAGAPIPPDLHHRMLENVLLEHADVHTPYGATECLPVSNFQGSRVLAETAGKTARGEGYCVGEPVPGVDIRITQISDAPIQTTADLTDVPQGEIGEILVRGPMVSRIYHKLPERTAEHKVYEQDGSGLFYHRIGDLGYQDTQGRLWFCGRKAHRVETPEGRLFTVCCEAVVNQHPLIYRSALIGLGDRPQQQPLFVVEPEAGALPQSTEARKKLADELFELIQHNPRTATIKTLLFRKALPVDIRHNAKIFREQLRPWAEAHLSEAVTR